MLDDSPSPFALNDRLADAYCIQRHLHRGRDLDVYEVWSELRDCLCVAKTLRPDRAQHDSSRRRLIREGRILLRLKHPHIVRAYELILRPQPVVILEVLGGATLEHILQRRRRLPVNEVAE